MVRGTWGVGILLAGVVAMRPQQPMTVNRLAWLAGCWEQRTARGAIHCSSTVPRGRSMLGVSRTIRGDSMSTHEFLMIRERAGVVAYHANPAGQAPAVFPAIHLDDTSVVFEDRQHDFPQRIGYTRRADSLLAWIEGTRNGQVRRIPYPYAKTACPA